VISVSSHNRLPLLITAALVLSSAWSATAIAQVWYPYPYPPHRWRGDADSAVRIEATPKDAQVYVDGYYAGVVDDFNGVFERLRVTPGPHEITLYRDGYRTVTQRIYLSPDSTFKFKAAMERLGPGEAAGPRPVPTNPPQAQAPAPVPARGPRGRPLPPPNMPPPLVPPANLPPPASSATEQQGTGTIALRVQPADAEVLIDGQPWRGSAGQDRVLVDLSEGRHQLQVRSSGYVGYLTEVEVRRGETATLDVTLRRQP
jgi:hypothetical protein